MKLDFAPRNVKTSQFLLFFSFFFALIFSSLGAAGSFGTKFQSFFIWVPTVLTAFACLTVTHLLFRSREIKLNFWVLTFFEGFVGSLIFAPFAYALDVYLGSDSGPYFSFSGIAEEFGHVYPPVAICWLLVKLPKFFGFILPARITPEFVERLNSFEQSKPIGDFTGTFFDSIPKEIGKDVIYLKAEKQYVMVTTSLGQKLIHLGLNQAIQSFSSDYGIRIHRSFWVTRKHIVKFDKKNLVVLLSNGTELSVSRRILKTIKHNF